MIMHKSTRNTRAKRGEERSQRRGTAEAAARQERGREKGSLQDRLTSTGISVCASGVRGCALFCHAAERAAQAATAASVPLLQQFVARGLFGHCDRGKVGAFFGQQAIKDDGDDRDVIAGASII